MALLIELKCKPVVKQYIVNRYAQQGQPNQITLPDRDWLKKMIERYLSRPDTNYDTQVTLQYYTERVDIPVPMRFYLDYGTFLTPTATMHINNHIQDLIDELLFEFLKFYTTIAGLQFKNAINLFREIYNIPEEAYSTAAIHKFWQRSRIKRPIDKRNINRIFKYTNCPAPKK